MMPSRTNSFNTPTPNGVEPTTNGAAADEVVPPPPPHRVTPSSPVLSDAEQAEAFKNKGNDAFKAGNYTQAVEFYTKGEFHGTEAENNVLSICRC